MKRPISLLYAFVNALTEASSCSDICATVAGGKAPVGWPARGGVAASGVVSSTGDGSSANSYAPVSGVGSAPGIGAVGSTASSGVRAVAASFSTGFSLVGGQVEVF